MTIKVLVGSQLEATLKTPHPNVVEGKFGPQNAYTFIVAGRDDTLYLSATSPANSDIQAMKAGDQVLIKKEPTTKGSVWVITHLNDVVNSVPAPEEFMETPVPPAFEDPVMIPSVDEMYAQKQKDKDTTIARLALIKASCALHGGSGNAEKAIESARIFETYVYE